MANSTLTIKDMRSVVASPFFSEMSDETKVINVNGNPMPRGYYNLIISIRDVKLYSRGIKPHRFWKISDVKTYFGLNGRADKMGSQLDEILEIIKTQEWERFRC